MEIRKVMTQHVEVISADATLARAAAVMARLDVGFLPVLDGEQLVGVITDRDIVVRGLADGMDPKNATVGDVMTQGMATLSATADVEEAIRLMEEKQIRRLVLQDDDEKYIGVVTIGDLALRTDDHELSGEALGRMCEPAGSTC